MIRDRVLIIEDDQDIVELLQYNFERDGFDVSVAQTGEQGLKAAQTLSPELVLLDLGLPGLQGLEVCRMIKMAPETASIPIIMLTARGEESDVVVGLEMGADDYVTKPFKVRELMARVRAVLRRSRKGPGHESESRVVKSRSLEIDSSRHEIRLNGQLMEFTLAEFRLLRYLAENPGRVLTRNQLLNEITDGTTYIIDRNVDVHIRSIRKKLSTSRDIIKTVRGVGYKFQDA